MAMVVELLVVIVGASVGALLPLAMRMRAPVRVRVVADQHLGRGEVHRGCAGGEAPV